MKRFRALRSWLIAFLLVLAGSVSAQQSAVPSSGAPRFEAATIKPSPANSEYGATSVWEFVPNGDVMVRNAPLRLIIAGLNDPVTSRPRISFNRFKLNAGGAAEQGSRETEAAGIAGPRGRGRRSRG